MVVPGFPWNVCPKLTETLRQIKSTFQYVHGPLQEFRSLRPGASGLPDYERKNYCTPIVCVPAVLGGLAVWRHTTIKISALVQ